MADKAPSTVMLETFDEAVSAVSELAETVGKTIGRDVCDEEENCEYVKGPSEILADDASRVVAVLDDTLFPIAGGVLVAINLLDGDELNAKKRQDLNTWLSIFDTESSRVESQSWVIDTSLDATLESVIPWAPGQNVSSGDLRSYNFIIYRANAAHPTKIGWEPVNVPSLWSVYQGSQKRIWDFVLDDADSANVAVIKFIAVLPEQQELVQGKLTNLLVAVAGIDGQTLSMLQGVIAARPHVENIKEKHDLFAQTDEAAEAASALADLKAAVNSAISVYETIAARASSIVGLIPSLKTAVEELAQSLENTTEIFMEEVANQATAEVNEANEKREEVDRIVNDVKEAEKGIETLLQDLAQISVNFGQAKSTLALIKINLLSLEKRKEMLESVPADQTQQAWCADYTEDLKGEVGTVELPGEGTVGQFLEWRRMIVRPGYAGAATYSAPRDGQLFHRAGMSPEQAFFNAAILPGWQRWMPLHRIGTITAIDYDADTCTLNLQSEDSSAQNLIIDPPIINTLTLSGVPIVYMDCDSQAFEEGDRVLVEFQNRDWSQPRVIGFEKEPKECGVCVVFRVYIESHIRCMSAGGFGYNTDGMPVAAPDPPGSLRDTFEPPRGRDWQMQWAIARIENQALLVPIRDVEEAESIQDIIDGEYQSALAGSLAGKEVGRMSYAVGPVTANGTNAEQHPEPICCGEFNFTTVVSDGLISIAMSGPTGDVLPVPADGLISVDESFMSDDGLTIEIRVAPASSVEFTHYMTIGTNSVAYQINQSLGAPGDASSIVLDKRLTGSGGQILRYGALSLDDLPAVTIAGQEYAPEAFFKTLSEHDPEKWTEVSATDPSPAAAPRITTETEGFFMFAVKYSRS